MMLATDPNMPPPEPVPPIIVPPEPNDPKPAVPPMEDDRPAEAPVKLPGRPGAPERVGAGISSQIAALCTPRGHSLLSI